MTEAEKLKAELKQLKAREAEIKKRLKELEAVKPTLDINVVSIYLKGGETELARALDGLEVGELKAVIKANALDLSRVMYRVKDHDKLRSFILDMAKRRATAGDVFRNYQY